MDQLTNELTDEWTDVPNGRPFAEVAADATSARMVSEALHDVEPAVSRTDAQIEERKHRMDAAAAIPTKVLVESPELNRVLNIRIEAGETHKAGVVQSVVQSHSLIRSTRPITFLHSLDSTGGRLNRGTDVWRQLHTVARRL